MDCHDRGASWHLAQFKPNSHRIAERNLARQGFRTFLPLQEVTVRTRGNFANHLRPLFPEYLFVAFDRLQRGWRAVNGTSGVTRLVGTGSTPAEVPLDLVSQLMLRCDGKGKLLPPRILHTGDPVTVTRGPLAQFVATVESLAPARRIWVLMDIMGIQTRVAMPVDHVRSH